MTTLRPLSYLFGLHVLTPGRRLYALGQIKESAAARSFTALVDDVDAAIAHDRRTLLQGGEGGRDLQEVRSADNRVDRALIIIDRLLSHYLEGEPKEASALHDALFPSGLDHHIRLPFIEQAGANDKILKVLDSDANAPWLDSHGFGPLVENLRSAHTAFETALLEAGVADSALSLASLKAHRETGQELYLKVVARILGMTLDDQDAYADLMRPVWVQNTEVQAHRRQRENLTEVDPDTGAPFQEGAPGTSTD